MSREVIPCECGCPYAVYVGIHIECSSPDEYEDCPARMDWEETYGEDLSAGLDAYYDVPGL